MNGQAYNHLSGRPLRQVFTTIAKMFGGEPSQEEDPRQIFDRFRQVLRGNNRALEIIADLGEKLGGDYIFDSQYIEDSVSRLIETVRASVEALNVLDPHHQELYTVHARLTDHLKAVLLGEEDRQGPRLLALDNIDPLQWAIVGGKFAHLAELIHYLKLEIPAGFVITTRTYHELLDHNGLRPWVDQFEGLWATEEATSGALEEVRGRLAAALLQAQPPPGFLEELASSLATLAERAPAGFSLAVRSSAQEEDLDFSFAGQFESVLNVPPRPAEVFQAYLQVAASLFGQAAVAYRRRVFPDRGRMSIACGCQIMIDSLASGVAYSTDPGNPGTDTMVVVGAWGQGAGIVEGEIPGDTFQLRKGNPPVVLSRQTSRKETGIYLAEGGGLLERPLREIRRNRPCLTDDQLLELARQAARLENYFKRPQDIE